MKLRILALLLLATPAVFARWFVGVGIGAPYAVYAAPPPPPVYYAPPPAPGYGYAWVGGYYHPYHRAWRWHGGYWARPPYRGAIWVAPRYHRGYWYRGYWRR